MKYGKNRLNFVITYEGSFHSPEIMIEYKELKEMMIRNRSYRRFDESVRISEDELKELVDLCRYTASGRNLQPLKYRLATSEEECAKVYPHLKWAGYLADWDGPKPGERPAAYLIQCLDTALTTNLLCDDGIQLEALTLGAVSKGLGCCIIKSFNKKEIKEVLGLSDELDPIYVLAIGKPVETVILEEMKDGEIEYWRDEEQKHHVPKRTLKEILVK